MFKQIGFLATFVLLAYSLISLGLLAWYYDLAHYSAVKSDDFRIVYVNSIRADLSCDLLLFVSAIIGLFLLAKPTATAGKFYSFWIVLLVLFKIVVGALTYTGGDEDGKNYVKLLVSAYDILEQYGKVNDEAKSFHVSYQNEIPSIIILSLLGVISAVCVLKSS